MTEEYDNAPHWPGARAVDFWRDPTIVRPVCKCGWASKKIFRPRKGFDPINTAIQYARDHGHVEPREWLAKNNPKLLESMDRAAGLVGTSQEIHVRNEGSPSPDAVPARPPRAWFKVCPVCGSEFPFEAFWRDHRKACWGRDLMGLHDDDKFTIYDRVEAMRVRGIPVVMKEDPSGFPAVRVMIGNRLALLTDCLSVEDWHRKRTGTRHFIVKADNLPFAFGVNAKDQAGAIAQIEKDEGHALLNPTAEAD